MNADEHRWKPRGATFVMLLFSLAVAFFDFGCSREQQRPLNLKIFFSGDTRGRLVPCGCFTGQFGGLTRLKTYLGETASTNDIRVDVGDAIAGAEDFQIIQYGFILRAYASMNYDALNIGQREAQLPLAELKRLKENSPVTLLSANLVDKQTGQKIFEACKVIQRGSFKIAIVGVVDGRGLAENLGDGLRVEPMESALEQLLPTLRKKVDAVILLAFTDENTLAKLAQQFYEPNLILGGKVAQPSQQLLKENRSTILYTANESRTVGALQVQIGAGRFVAKDFEMVMLHDKIPEDDSISKLAVEYREKIRGARLAVDDLKRLDANSVPGVRNKANFVGSESCLSCHKAAGKIWEHSEHANAFASLTDARADADPNCIGCHAIGFGTTSGYRREFGGKKLANVGCESCHGPGSLHVAQKKDGGKVAFKFRPLGSGDCKQCHFGEFSRPFDWDAFWPKIEHGSEPKTAGLSSQQLRGVE